MQTESSSITPPPLLTYESVPDGQQADDRAALAAILVAGIIYLISEVVSRGCNELEWLFFSPQRPVTWTVPWIIYRAVSVAFLIGLFITAQFKRGRISSRAASVGMLMILLLVLVEFVDRTVRPFVSPRNTLDAAFIATLMEFFSYRMARVIPTIMLTLAMLRLKSLPPRRMITLGVTWFAVLMSVAFCGQAFQVAVNGKIPPMSLAPGGMIELILQAGVIPAAVISVIAFRGIRPRTPMVVVIPIILLLLAMSARSMISNAVNFVGAGIPSIETSIDFVQTIGFFLRDSMTAIALLLLGMRRRTDLVQWARSPIRG